MIYITIPYNYEAEWVKFRGQYMKPKTEYGPIDKNGDPLKGMGRQRTAELRVVVVVVVVEVLGPIDCMCKILLTFQQLSRP